MDAILDWLREEGYPHTLEADGSMTIQYAPSPDGHLLAVNLEHSQDRIILVLRMLFNDDHAAALNREGIISTSAQRQIRRELFLRGIGVNLEGEPLESFLVDDVIYADGLSKDHFFRVLRQLYGAAFFIVDVLDGAVDGGLGVDI
ncbi:MAG: DUF2299 family protein [Thermoplasmatota archaeon]